MQHLLKKLEEAFLVSVWELSSDSCFGDETRFPFKTLSIQTGLSKHLVAALCRNLKERGLMEYSSGLWTEDGMPAGSGYGLSRLGAKWCEENA